MAFKKQKWTTVKLNQIKKLILHNIQAAVKSGNYVVRSHVVNHMITEDFRETHIIEAIENGTILELYADESRCLIKGTFQLSKKGKESLHVVIDYWSEFDNIDWVDLVTAYIPRYPFWETAIKRGRKQ